MAHSGPHRIGTIEKVDGAYLDGNTLYFACKESSCVCLAKEKMACTGEEGETKCTEICATFAPDKTPACNKNYCDCT